jgi:hypothetical protein
VQLGEPVVVITPQGTMTPAGTLPRLKTFRVVGVFEVGMYEFDSGLALIDLDDARKLYRLDGVSGVRLEARRSLRRAGGGARARRERSRSTAKSATGREATRISSVRCRSKSASCSSS